MGQGKMTAKNYEHTSLEGLLDLYRRSAPEAFTEFFNRTAKLIFRFLHLRLGNKAEAEDVMQETYFRIHRYVASYNVERNALTWIMSIARHAMVDYVRARRGMQVSVDLNELQLASGHPGPDRLAEFRQLVAQACKGLSSEELEILAERTLNGASYQEIAKQRGITVENARQKISRLIKRLKSGLSTP